MRERRRAAWQLDAYSADTNVFNFFINLRDFTSFLSTDESESSFMETDSVFVAFLNASQLISPTVEMKTLLCWTVSLHTPRCDSAHAKNKQTYDLQKLPNHFLNSRSGHSFQSQSFPRLPFTTIFPGAWLYLIPPTNTPSFLGTVEYP